MGQWFGFAGWGISTDAAGITSAYNETGLIQPTTTPLPRTTHGVDKGDKNCGED